MNIKNGIYAGVVMMIVVLLSGCSRSSEIPETIVSSEAPIASQSGGSSVAQSPKDVEDWAMAIANGEKLHCSYPIEEGIGNAEFFADGMQYRMEYSSPEGRMISVFDGETVFMWNEGEKIGFSQTMTCMDELADSLPKGPNMPETYESSEEAISTIPNIQCERVSTVDLSVPDDITFTDQCAMLKDQMKAMEDMMKNIPESSSGMELLP